MRIDLATALSDPEHVVHQATESLAGNSLSFQTTLPEPAVTTSKETAPSFIERIVAVHTVTRANEKMTRLSKGTPKLLIPNCSRSQSPLLNAVLLKNRDRARIGRSRCRKESQH